MSSWLGLSNPRSRGHSLKQGYFLYILYYFCFCSVDKIHHLHRRWNSTSPKYQSQYFADSWYVQVDGLAMSASFAVILVNLWLKVHEFALRQEIPVGMEVQQINDNNGLCPCCSRKVTYRSKGVEYESCRNWYHLKSGKYTNTMTYTHQSPK